MDKKYPYLRNKSAVEEIRKHKWLESEKNGQEIGFASAAIDWIKKYGKDWKKYYIDTDGSIKEVKLNSHKNTRN